MTMQTFIVPAVTFIDLNYFLLAETMTCHHRKRTGVNNKTDQLQAAVMPSHCHGFNETEPSLMWLLTPVLYRLVCCLHENSAVRKVHCFEERGWPSIMKQSPLSHGGLCRVIRPYFPPFQLPPV